MSIHHKADSLQTIPKPNHQSTFNRISFFTGLIGLVSLLISFLLAKTNMGHFFFSFHVSWLYFVSIAFGSIFFVLIQYASRAGWGVVLRRLAENISLTMPLFLCLFLLVCIGSHTLFHHWLSEESFQDQILATKRWYLNLPFFYSRSFFYLTVFTFVGYFFAKKSALQDSTGDHSITSSLQTLSYPCLILCGFCIHFAATDWIMSLDPHWYSTIFGLYFFAGSYMASIAALIIFVAFTQRNSNLKNIFTVEHYHDLGKLLFGHSCFWAYAAFSQYLLIWYANIPEETKWYGIRQSNDWWWVWTALCVGHFLVPLLFLMARKAKRALSWLTFVAIWMLIMHFIDLYWLVMPANYPENPPFSLLDILCFVGIGGLFVSVLCYVAKKKSLVPMQDPRLSESLTYENI